MHWRCDMGHFKKACILFIYIKTGVAFWCAQYSTTPSLAIYVNTCPISVWLLSLAVHANIARGALPGSKFFHFHAVFAKQIGKHTHFGSRRPPLDRHCQPGDILCRPGRKMLQLQTATVRQTNGDIRVTFVLPDPGVKLSVGTNGSYQNVTAIWFTKPNSCSVTIQWQLCTRLTTFSFTCSVAPSCGSLHSLYLRLVNVVAYDFLSNHYRHKGPVTYLKLKF